MVKKIKVLVLITVLVFSFCSSVFAGDAGRKLIRGCFNIAFGGLEILVQLDKGWKQDKNIIGVGVGFIKGIAAFIGREIVGAYELVTFPIPLPQGYEPIIEPEFVLEGARNMP